MVEYDRNADGTIARIIERRDDDSEKRSGPCEVNSGAMVLSVPWLQSAIPRLTPSNATGEIYLTELVAIATNDGAGVDAHNGSAEVLVGVNNRAELAHAEALIIQQTIDQHMAAGVTFTLPLTSVVEPGVQIGPDSVILPGCQITAGSRIGANCVIGPNSVLANADIGDNCTISASWIEHSRIEANSDVGPFSHVRGNSRVGPDVHIGNFAEVKNSVIHSGVRSGHFSYIGDSEIGSGSNIGAGVVTCNFDGTNKHRTLIGENVFVGSGTMLVAPIELGDGSMTGAGSVVTHDVQADQRVVGVPARPISRKTTEE